MSNAPLRPSQIGEGEPKVCKNLSKRHPTVDWSSPAALVLKAGGVDTSLLTLEHNASKRELFIANVQPESSDLTLRAFLETLIAQAETLIHTGDIIKSLRLSGTHAFLEAQSSCDASAPLRV